MIDEQVLFMTRGKRRGRLRAWPVPVLLALSPLAVFAAADSGTPSPKPFEAERSVAADTSPPVPAEPLGWHEEIDSLLAFVGGLTDATFIRNGSDYTAAQAVAHLRLKRSRQDPRIRSTDDFILQCATRSSFTGRAYRIRFADGSVRPAAEVLREELTRLRGADEARRAARR